MPGYAPFTTGYRRWGWHEAKTARRRPQNYSNKSGARDDQKRERNNNNKPEGKIQMLILTRRIGETVVIGNDVDVTVLSVKGNQVRLGVKAPKEVTVHREEIYDRICQEQQNGQLLT